VPTSIVNEPLTILLLASLVLLCHERSMARQNKLGGGCFLIIPILIGFVAGMATGNAYRGVLIGTGIGIMLAVAVWLIDRSRKG